MHEKYYIYKIYRNPTIPPDLFALVSSKQKAAEAFGRLLYMCEFGEVCICITTEAINAEDESLCPNACSLYGGSMCPGWEDCYQ